MIKIAVLLALVIAAFAKHHHKNPSFLVADAEYDVIPESHVTYALDV
jgi:hypothetical protein